MSYLDARLHHTKCFHSCRNWCFCWCNTLFMHDLEIFRIDFDCFSFLVWKWTILHPRFPAWIYLLNLIESIVFPDQWSVSFAKMDLGCDLIVFLNYVEFNQLSNQNPDCIWHYFNQYFNLLLVVKKLTGGPGGYLGNVSWRKINSTQNGGLGRVGPICIHCFCSFLEFSNN